MPYTYQPSKRLLPIATSIAAIIGTPAFAQENYLLTLEEVTITGTKLEQSLQDVEVSTEVFDAARLEREQINELSDLLLKVPNVNTSGGSDANFSIRGIGRGGVGGAGQGVTSNIYIDGAPLTSTGINRGPSTLWDIQQVEVLRGPQSSVQGRNALAGAIVVKTADPTFDSDGKFKATFAEGDTYQVAGAYGGAIIDNLLAGRIAIDVQGSDGFNSNALLGGDDFNVTESVSVRGKLLFAPAGLPEFTSKLTVDYNESEVFGADNNRVQAPVGLTDPNFSDFDPTDLISFDEPNGNDNEGLRIVSETAYDLSDALTARAILTYEDYETDRFFGDLDDLTLFNENVLNQFDETIYSAELRLEFEYDNVKGLAGAYYYQDETNTNRNQQLRFLETFQSLVPAQLRPLVSESPGGTIITLTNGETIETENYAVFGQLDWSLSEKWTLGLGARYDFEEFLESDSFDDNAISNDSCLVTAPVAVLVPGAPSFAPLTVPCQVVVNAFTGAVEEAPLEADFDAFLPRASLTYDINENSSVFVAASRGYRAGGSFTAIEPNIDGTIGIVPFTGTYEPEFLTTYEVGTRNVLLDGRLTLNANLFFSDYEDQQVLIDGFSPNETRDDLIVNAGESSIYGFELSANYKVSESTNAFFSLGLLETEFDDFPFAVDSNGNPTNPDDARFANLAGNSFPGAPDVTFTIGADWQNDRGFFGSASFTFTGKSEAAVGNIDNDDLRVALVGLGFDPNLAADFTSRSEERTDLTARFGWANESMQTYIFGTNLLDDDGVASQNLGNVGRLTGQVTLSDSPAFTLQQPRSVGVGVEFLF